MVFAIRRGGTPNSFQQLRACDQGKNGKDQPVNWCESPPSTVHYADYKSALVRGNPLRPFLVFTSND
jgi:hypothetical protein